MEDDDGGGDSMGVDDGVEWFRMESLALSFIFFRFGRISDLVNASRYSRVLGLGTLGSSLCLPVFQCLGKSLLAWNCIPQNSHL